MAEGKRRDEWDRTSHIMAYIANSQRTENPLHPAQCNPFLADEFNAKRPKEKDVKHLARIMGIPVDKPGDANGK